MSALDEMDETVAELVETGELVALYDPQLGDYRYATREWYGEHGGVLP